MKLFLEGFAFNFQLKFSVIIALQNKKAPGSYPQNKRQTTLILMWSAAYFCHRFSQGKVPESLYQQAAALADRERISVDALVALALNAQAPACLARESIAARAKRDGVKNLDRVTRKLRDVKPAANDRI